MAIGSNIKMVWKDVDMSRTVDISPECVKSINEQIKESAEQMNRSLYDPIVIKNIMSEIRTSKTFHRLVSGRAIKTATVKDLIEFLSLLPDDMPVMATWEGTYHEIKDYGIYQLENVTNPCNVLYLEVD